MTLFAAISDIHSDKVPLGPVKIAGWVRTRRGSKKFSFLEITDGSGAKNIQVIADSVLPNYEEVIAKLVTGCSVAIEGELVASPGQGQKYEVRASKVDMFGFADPETYPLQKKEMSFEYLREVAHMRPRTATFGSVFRIRSRMSLAVHNFFNERGFFYVHTPLITTSDGEGAGEAFKVTTLNLEKIPKTTEGKVDFSKDFFEEPSLLCVTGQLEGELMAMGLGKVYTFGPTFRAENSNTSRHLAEFWMIEPEMAFFDLKDTMKLAQDFITYMAKDVLENCADDLEFLSTKVEQDPRPYLHTALEKPFTHVTYTDAVDILQKAEKKFEYPVEWGLDLKSEHERYLCEEHFAGPTIVYNYPAHLKAFYMYMNDDGKTVGAMDLLMPGIGEVIGGSQREDRESVLVERMKEKGIEVSHMDWYVSLRRFGGVPHSGFGLGFERLLMWVTGMGNIRDVIPFPRVPGSCKF